MCPLLLCIGPTYLVCYLHLFSWCLVVILYLNVSHQRWPCWSYIPFRTIHQLARYLNYRKHYFGYTRLGILPELIYVHNTDPKGKFCGIRSGTLCPLIFSLPAQGPHWYFKRKCPNWHRIGIWANKWEKVGWWRTQVSKLRIIKYLRHWTRSQ